jgi:hypothetical protein
MNAHAITGKKENSMPRVLCIHCLHFDDNSGGSCLKFRWTNPVRGTIVFETAYNIRMDEEACGWEGRFFDPNPEIMKPASIKP